MAFSKRSGGDNRRELVFRETLRLTRRTLGAPPGARLKELGFVGPTEITELQDQIASVVQRLIGAGIQPFAENLKLVPTDTIDATHEKVVYALGRLPGSTLPPPDEIIKNARKLRTTALAHDYTFEEGNQVDAPGLAGDPIYPPDDEDKGSSSA